MRVLAALAVATILLRPVAAEARPRWNHKRGRTNLVVTTRNVVASGSIVGNTRVPSDGPADAGAAVGALLTRIGLGFASGLASAMADATSRAAGAIPGRATSDGVSRRDQRPFDRSGQVTVPLAGARF